MGREDKMEKMEKRRTKGGKGKEDWTRARNKESVKFYIIKDFMDRDH